MTVNFILNALEYFVSKLEAKIGFYESKAIDSAKQIEALVIQKEQHFAEAVRLRNITAKAREFLR
jgi:hypothetical protein